MRTLLIILVLKFITLQVQHDTSLRNLITFETTLEERVNQLETDLRIFKKSHELSEQEKKIKERKEQIYCYVFMVLSIMGYIMLAIYLIRNLNKYRILKQKQNRKDM